MTNFSFSDDDLRAAAAVVCDAMPDTFPEPSEIRFPLSGHFIHQMNSLCAKARRRAWMRKTLKRAAMFLLAGFITLGAWLAFHTDARAALLYWVREVYENHIIYRFFDRAAVEELPVYTVTWLPEDFSLEDEDANRTRRFLYYENRDTGGVVLFEYHLLSDGFQTHFMDIREREAV